MIPDLKFLILAGPLQGQEFELRPGQIIGRSRGDIVLKDKKVSTRHAEIIQRPEGLFLLDLVSQNGLWVGGERRTEVPLVPGTEVRLGQSVLRVELKKAHDSDALRRIREQIRRTRDLPISPLAELHPFSPPVQLIYQAGPQAGEVEILGFGPRRFGSGVLDVQIMDPEAPELAFELRMGAEGLEIQALQGEVRINGSESLRIQTLAEGDWIQVGKSVLEVRRLTDERDEVR